MRVSSLEQTGRPRGRLCFMTMLPTMGTVFGRYVKGILKEATGLLKAAGIPSPRVDAEVLLGFVLGCDRLALYREPLRKVAAEELVRYKELLYRRADGEPVAYLTGEKEFMGLSFTVTQAVLVPRPETELLVETAASLLKAAPAAVVADVGTGCGAIAVSLAVLLPEAQVFAVDISEAALAVARENARRHRVEGRVTFLEGDLLQPLMEAGHSFDLVAANLPYVPREDMPDLSREVRHEPALALDGGPGGLVLYRRLVHQAMQILKPGGCLVAEIDHRQAQAALALVPVPAWASELRPDLAGRPRLVVARLSGSAGGR